MLVCKVCSIEKEDEEFPVASITKSGRAGECRKCKSIRIKKLRTEREHMLHDLFHKRCGHCGLTDEVPSFFDFHHVKTSTKIREVKQIICGSLESLMKEVKKCVMLCPNCHRRVHLKEGWK